MGKILFYIALILMGPYMVYSDGAIRKDFSMRSETLNPAFVQTTDRKCTSTFYIFHQCGYKYQSDGVEVKQDYMMFAFGAPETVFLLRGSDSGQITSSVGQEYLWNRVLSMAIMLLASLFTGMAMLSAFKSMGSDEEDYELQALRQAQPLTQPAPQNYGQMSSNNSATGFGRRTGFQSR